MKKTFVLSLMYGTVLFVFLTLVRSLGDVEGDWIFDVVRITAASVIGFFFGGWMVHTD